MKRILSLVLAALMLLTCLSAMVSCSQEAKTEEKTEKKTQEKTGEASSSTKGKAPASTAAVTTQKPAPATTKEPAPATTTVSTPKPTAPQVTVPTYTPSSQLPEDLKAISAIAIPNDLIGTTWSFVKGDYNGTEIGVDEMGNAAIEFLTSTSVSLIDEADSEACSLTIDRSARYLSFSNDFATFYGVFTVKSGVTTLAIATPEQSGMVLYFEEGAEAILPSDPENIPEIMQSYLLNASPVPAIDGTTWILTGGKLDGVTLTPELLEAMGEVSLSFSENQATAVAEGQSMTVDVQNNGRYLTFSNDGEDFYAVFLETEGETVLYYLEPDNVMMFTQK